MRNQKWKGGGEGGGDWDGGRDGDSAGKGGLEPFRREIIGNGMNEKGLWSTVSGNSAFGWRKLREGGAGTYSSSRIKS